MDERRRCYENLDVSESNAVIYSWRAGDHVYQNCKNISETAWEYFQPHDDGCAIPRRLACWVSDKSSRFVLLSFCSKERVLLGILFHRICGPIHLIYYVLLEKRRGVSHVTFPSVNTLALLTSILLGKVQRRTRSGALMSVRTQVLLEHPCKVLQEDFFDPAVKCCSTPIPH